MTWFLWKTNCCKNSTKDVKTTFPPDQLCLDIKQKTFAGQRGCYRQVDLIVLKIMCNFKKSENIRRRLKFLILLGYPYKVRRYHR